MTAPVIGVTAYCEDISWRIEDTVPKEGRGVACVLPDTYLAALRRHGAVPVVLPPQTDSVGLLDRLDAVVLAGGPDVGADRYGAPADPHNDRPRTERDQAELAIYHRARALDLPVLGICRGLQVMVVAEGGRLIQHLPDRPGSDQHASPDGPVDHRVRLAAGSLLRRIYAGADQITVNSFHHQAVDRPGETTATAVADDQVIEACEVAGGFCLGVQWHPEFAGREQADAPLWTALVRAASDRATSGTQ